VHEVADTALAVHEGADERQAPGVSERLEDLVGRCAKRLAAHGAQYFAKWRNLNQELPQFVSAA
jgi:fructose-bisphosphate aldolase class 1